MPAQAMQDDGRLTGAQVSHDAEAIAGMAEAGYYDGRVPIVLGGWPLDRHNIHNQSIWHSLPLTYQLDFPLRYMCFDIADIAAMSNIMGNPDNETLRQLSLDINPDSETFGDSRWTERCDILLSRADAHSLEVPDVKALEAYARLELADVRILQDLEARVTEEAYEAARDKAKVTAGKATPEHFSEFRKKYVKGPVCRACGIPTGWRGATLSSCSKCKAAHYCGKDCQVKDWKIHKASKEHKSKKSDKSEEEHKVGA